MSAHGWAHGKNLTPDGEVRYLSPSAATLADPGSDGGCLRKFYYQYRLGIKVPGSKAQADGQALHAELERYIKTGNRNMSALALAGLHMVPPPPHDDVLVEHEMSSAFSDPEHAFAVDEARALRLAGDLDGARRMLESVEIVSASGIPIIGRIDLVHGRGTNQGTEDPSDALDPPGTIEILDFKTSSNVERYAKTPAELGRTIQMLAYGMWAALDPEVHHVRLSHAYFQTKGRPVTRKVSVRLPRTEILARWEYAENLARRIADAARLPSVDDVEPNLSACGSFGGCFYADQCSARQSKQGLIFPRKEKKDPMALSVLDKIKKADAERAAPAVPPEFAKAWQTIKDVGAKLGHGYPSVAGDAAKWVAAIDKLPDFKGQGLAGAGNLGSATVANIEDAQQVAGELAEVLAESESDPAIPTGAAESTAPPPPPAATKVTPLAPDAPASDPAIASAGPEGKDPTKKGGTRSKAKPAAEAPKVEVPPTAGGFALFVDCVPSCAHVRLEIDLLKLADDVAALASEELGAKVYDIRACDAKPLGFGGWRGVYAGHVFDMKVPDGPVVVMTGGSELLQVACEALSKRATMFVRPAGAR